MTKDTVQDTIPSYRFYVEINDMPQAVFTEVGGLQIETVMMDYEEGGNNAFVHKLPGRTKVGNLTLKRGMTGSRDFINWYMQFLEYTAKPQNISVVVYNPKGEEMLRWNFDAAFPVKWVGPQLTADGKTAAIETLELAHKGMHIGSKKKAA